MSCRHSVGSVNRKGAHLSNPSLVSFQFNHCFKKLTWPVSDPCVNTSAWQHLCHDSRRLWLAPPLATVILTQGGSEEWGDKSGCSSRNRGQAIKTHKEEGNQMLKLAI